MKAVRILAWSAVVAVLIFAAYRYASTTKQPVSTPNLAANAGPGGPFTLTSHAGKIVSDTDFRGKFMLVYFGYSYCPDVCRIELHKITVALNILDESGFDITPIQPLFISVDPERDTVAELADYVQDYHPSLIALTGTLDQIKDVAKKYKVYFSKRPQEEAGDYLMDHQSFIFVMDQDGVYNRLFSSRDTPQDIADVFKTVLDKKP
jgi:cytochrome oxidase Cu insertion factor (SCO1/SenC/PrrC family)